MRVGVALAVGLWLLGAAAPAWAQAQLGAIREDVKGQHNNPSPSDSKDNSHKASADDSGSDSDDDDFSLTWIFSVLFHSPDERRLFPAYPYYKRMPGYMQLDPGPEGKVSGHTAEELDLSPWSFRLSVENGTNFDDIDRFTGTLQIENRCGLGLYTSWNYLYENLGFGYFDDLVLGNVTLTWRFLESRRLIMRWGVGAWILSDTCGCNRDAGVNVHLSGDYFPVKPFVFSGLIEGGNLGHTGIVHTRLTAGVLWRGLEFYGGYDFFQVGSTNLHTPMLGIRVWF